MPSFEMSLRPAFSRFIGLKDLMRMGAMTTRRGKILDVRASLSDATRALFRDGAATMTHFDALAFILLAFHEAICATDASHTRRCACSLTNARLAIDAHCACISYACSRLLAQLRHYWRAFVELARFASSAFCHLCRVSDADALQPD